MIETAALQNADLTRLQAWMAAQGLGNGAIENAERLAGGSQNVLVKFELGGRGFVLRKAAATSYADGDETMRREARVLRALKDTPVPHARLIASCENRDVIGGAFYLMEPVDGFNVAIGMPSLHAGSAAVRREMGFAMVEALAALGEVDYAAAGLEDFGRIDNFLERQIGRWSRQLESYGKYARWPGVQSLPAVTQIAAWLDSHRPLQFEPGIVHGDYHLKNVLFCNGSPEIAAIIDWELSTLGAPLIDLGWLLATWREPGGGSSSTPIIIEPWEGFPSSDELIERYAQRSGRDVSDIQWYRVFACFKLALIIEGTHARACAGQADLELGRKFHTNAVNLLLRAVEWVT